MNQLKNTYQKLDRRVENLGRESRKRELLTKQDVQSWKDGRGRKVEDRFWKKVKIRSIDQCWFWNGDINKQGYGQFWTGKKRYPAHRISFLLKNGSIKKGLFVLHKCDKPACVNPKHLFLGTIQDNSNDMKKKGRSCFGEKHWKCKFKEFEIVLIRQLKNILSSKEISLLFNTTTNNIYSIIHKKTWTHLN